MIRRATYRDIDGISLIGHELHDNFDHLFDLSYLLNNEYSRIYIYEEEGKILGFIHVDSHFEIMDLVNIVVLKEYQHRGIGKSLLKFVIENETYDKIMLEVRETNTNAIKLYEMFDFKEIYRRKKYYGDCDAIIMERMK
jgi:ribosomal-protein-alanine N-acetyltransferase